MGTTVTETYYDGIDSDCDGASDYDADGDGEDAAAFGGDDCDDSDPGLNPDATEIWYDDVTPTATAHPITTQTATATSARTSAARTATTRTRPSTAEPPRSRRWHRSGLLEADAISCYADADGDGHGSSEVVFEDLMLGRGRVHGDRLRRRRPVPAGCDRCRG